MSSESFQAWWIHHLSGQSIPIPDHPTIEEISPNIQYNLALLN